ncbi:MAG: hypothetical protein H0U92_06765, partial [Actinobacteria bacterium]|nr:hypothetical protein [Actinomycetota bacterium]
MDEWDSEFEEEAEPTRPRPEGVRILGAEEAAAAVNAQESGTEAPQEPLRFERRIAPPPDETQLGFSFDDDDEAPRAAVTPAPPNLPHWTEPPTGEVPAVLSGRFGESDVDVVDGEESEDDLAAWSALSGGAPRWRDQHDAWDDAGFDDASVLAGSEPPMGALDETRTSVFSFDDIDQSDDDFTFGDDDVDVAPIPLRPPTTPPVTARPPRPRPPRPSRSMGAG